MNIKKICKFALFTLPFLAINLFPKNAEASNLTIAQYTLWCTQTKGGQVVIVALAAGISYKCQVKNDKGDFVDIPGSGVVFSLFTDEAKDYCLIDSNKNGKEDKGDEVTDRHGNKLAKNIAPFSNLSSPSVPIAPLVLASLNQASQNLFANTEFDIWVALTLNSSGNLEMEVDLKNVPHLNQNPTFSAEGFTEINLVYRDSMGSLNGINLGTLNQGEKNFLEFNPVQFNSFGGFSVWQIGVSIYNPTTQQQALQFEDHPIPEPTSILSILSLGILGAGATLKRKVKPSKSTAKEATKIG